MGRTLDRHPYDAGAFEDDYRGFDLQDDEGGRGPLILALAMGVLLISGAVIWNTYKQGVKPNAAALPVVFADAEPYKRAPDDAGGVVAEDLERRIYDQMDGSVRTTSLGEAAAAGSAEPVLHGGPPVELRPGRTVPLTPSSSASTTGSVATSALPEVAERRAQNEAAGEIAPVVPSAPQTFVAEGGFLVQVAALRSEAAAEAAWGQFVSDDRDLFSGAEKMVQRADLGAKGIFYRLRVGAFAERTDASSFCDALKARDKSCIVVAR
jgi:cell division septation protein DedD